MNRRPAFSLLSDSLFEFEAGDGSRRVPLPGLIAFLLGESVPELRFPHLTAVQRGHWWRFLVRTASHVHHSLSHGQPRALSVEEIRKVLEESTGGEDAWCLHNPDLERPAFLQPPLPHSARSQGGFKAAPISYLSSALGAKNHERKVDATPALTAEQTVYALLELQGGAIYGGRGNYPSQLTAAASGKGSGTPFMGVLLPDGWGATFRHDVGVLLRSWDELERVRGLRGPVWALWAEPWDGVTSLPATSLTPAFVPLARMVRLAEPDAEGRFRTVYYRASKTSRVVDHTAGGYLGDPFLPLIETDAGWKVRGVVAHHPSRPAFDYRETVAFFIDDDRRPSPTVEAFISTETQTGDRAALLLLEGLAFEQGKTLGFHQRVVPVFPEDRRLLAEPDPLRAANEALSGAVKEASAALRGAVRILLHGDPAPRTGDDGPLTLASAPLMNRVDEHYIRFLFDAGQQEREGADAYKAEWVELLRQWARETLQRAEDALPRADARRFQRSVRAEAFLNAKFRRMLDEVRGIEVTQPA